MKRTLGTISAAVMLTMTLGLGVAVASDSKPDPEAVFAEIDANKDGKISKEEFVKVYDDKVVAERQFIVFDKNGDGYIVKEEYTMKVTPMPKDAPAAPLKKDK